jgi:hypothetical protein
MDGRHRLETVAGRIGEAEGVVGEQRRADRLDPRRHLVNGHRDAVLDLGRGVVEDVPGVIDDVHPGPLLGPG